MFSIRSLPIWLIVALLFAACTTSETPSTTPTGSAATPAATASPADTGTPAMDPHGMATPDMPATPAPVGTPHAIPGDNEEGALSGMLLGVEEDTIVVKNDAGMEFVFFIDETVVVEPEGDLKGLEPGTILEVNYVIEEGKMKAKTVKPGAAGHPVPPEGETEGGGHGPGDGHGH